MKAQSENGSHLEVRSQPKEKKSNASKQSREYLNWIATYPCVACGKRGEQHEDGVFRVAPAHIKSRGSGGHDIGNVIPLCYRCHNQQHQLGWQTFEMIHQLKAEQIAKTFQELYEHA